MDDFSDDSLDDLNDNVLQELENAAVQLTQAHHLFDTNQTQHGHHDHSQSLGVEFEADDLDDTVVFDELAKHPAKPLPVVASIAPPRPQPPPRWEQGLVRSHLPAAPGRGQSMGSRHAPFQRPQPPRPILSGRPSIADPGESSQFNHFNAQIAARPRPAYPPPRAREAAGGGPAPARQDDLIAQLRAQLSNAQRDAMTAKGEAALLRSKYQDSQTAYEAEIARIKKLNADQLAKHERIAEQALAAEEVATTELEFAKRDLKDELGRARKEKVARPAPVANSGPTTPRKGAVAGNNRWAVADGFDDIELIPSPSKGPGRRSKETVTPVERTPSKAKRRRPLVDSPLLELETDDDVMVDGHFANEEKSGPVGADVPLFDFLPLVLDHSSFHTQPLTFDLFSRYSFPSDPTQTFASIIFSKLPSLRTHYPMQLLVDFCQAIINMWSQCLHEKYYEPIYDLVALVTFTLLLQTTEVGPQILSHLLPVAQASIELQVVGMDGDPSSHPDPTIRNRFLYIPISHILSLLHLTALGCSPPFSSHTGSPHPPQPSHLATHEQTSQGQFWSMIGPEVILTLLSPKQRPEDLLVALALLRTSVLPSSIGPISNDPAKDAHIVAKVIINHISLYLLEASRYHDDEVKLAVLETMLAFTRSPFGLLKLMQNDYAIPRIVVALSGAVDMLYDMDVPPLDTPESTASHAQDPDPIHEQKSATDARPPMALLHAIISQSVLLLHALVTTASAEDNTTGSSAGGRGGGPTNTTMGTSVAAKLATSRGGSQRYLLTLARLNFAEEDLVLEAGIDTKTAELANELLELAVTPDEGDGIKEVFD